jgi:murein DD-endopeptidase MepM/ murein hydrolase activator NlpD
VSRRDKTTTASIVDQWRQSAAAALSSPDGRWAFASTSITAVVAGSIAWLGMGALVPQAPTKMGREASFSHALFQRLNEAGKPHDVAYASLSPLGAITTNPGPETAPMAEPLDNSLASESSEEIAGAGGDTRTVTIEPGQTLAAALVAAGASQSDSNAAVIALAKVFSPSDLRAGQSLAVTFGSPEKTERVSVAQIIYAPPADAAERDDAMNAADASSPEVGRLLSISFSPTIQQDITIDRSADGGFVAKSTTQQLEVRYHRAGAKIDSSLYLAAMQAGIPARIVLQLIHVFSYEVDFQRDLHPGDTFEVLYSFYDTLDGKPAKEGDVAYASIHLADRTVTLYRYQPKGDIEAEYYNAKGQSARSMLMKTPVDGARISSGFGMRFHPVLGYTRMHKGIDFAVPTGTPVMAAGSGVIQYAGWEGGYGNFIVLNHGNTYATAYGHLSRFAPGIRTGSHVRQGEVIAYSGATGLATGPHLHYEIRINGTQVNPATVKVARGRILMGRELVGFEIERLHVDGELAAMPLENRLADSAPDLRAAKE